MTTVTPATYHLPRRGHVRPSARRPRAWLVVICLVGVGLPVAVAAVTGNLAIPHNDAWSYSRIAQTFARTGHITLLGWNRTSLIGQVVLLGPLGSSLTAQQVAVAVLATVLIYCVYDLVGVSATAGGALIAAGLVTTWPGFASLATSFMTDIPYLAAAFAALVLGRRALIADSRTLFLSALFVGLWASTIREQAIAAPIAVLAWAAITSRTRRNLSMRIVVFACLAGAALFVGFLLWRQALPHGDHPHVTLTAGYFLGSLRRQIPGEYLTLALPLTPAIALVARPRQWKRAEWCAAGVGCALVVMGWRSGFFFGNYLSQTGEYSGVLLGSHVVIGSGLWHVVMAIGAFGGVLLPPTLLRTWRAVDPILGIFTVLTALAVAGTGAIGQGIFDRYLLALVPGVLAAVLARDTNGHSAGQDPSRALSRIAAVASVVGVLVLSMLLAANAYAFDIARWHAAEQIARKGIPAFRIDAGLEWLGWHSPHGVINRYPARRDDGFEPMFSHSLSCIVLSSAPLGRIGARRKWSAEREYRYQTFLLAGSAVLYVYATHARGCQD